MPELLLQMTDFLGACQLLDAAWREALHSLLPVMCMHRNNGSCLLYSLELCNCKLT